MKKVGLLVVLLFSVFVLSACSNEGKLHNVDSINKEDIFNQKEDAYYIYFHRVDCPDCEQTSPSVIEYATVRLEKAGCSDKRKIYSVLVYTKDEKPGEDTYIYREYTGDDGEGTDGKYKVTGVTEWDDLYIATTSALIAINTNKDGVKVASYVAQGANNVVSNLAGQLGECYSK